MIDQLPYPNMETVVFSPWLEIAAVRYGLAALIALFFTALMSFLCLLPKKKARGAVLASNDPWIRLSWDFTKTQDLRLLYADALLTQFLPTPARALEILYGARQATPEDYEIFAEFFVQLKEARRKKLGLE